MISGLNVQPIPPSADPSPEWSDDCLTITVLLAATMSPQNMKRILTQQGYRIQTKRIDPAGLLMTMHWSCHQDQDLTARLTKILNRRFSKTVTAVRRLGVDRIRELIEECDRIIPYLWACCQHPDREVRHLGRRLAHRAVFEGLNRIEDDSDPTAAETELDRLTGRCRGLEDDLARKERETKRLTEELAEQRRINQELLDDLNELTDPAAPDPVQPCRAESDSFPLIETTAGETDLAAQRLSELEQLVEAQRQEIDQWRRLAAMGPSPEMESRPICSDFDQDQDEDDDRPCPDCEARSCSGDSPRPCLNGCRVALVGGHDGLTPEYCKLVEDLGGEALIHNGKVKSGSKKVRDLVRKSDLVVYLTTINSHGAMKSFKKHCKLCQKPFCPCRGTGVGALRNFLEGEVSQKILPTMFD